MYTAFDTPPVKQKDDYITPSSCYLQHGDDDEEEFYEGFRGKSLKTLVNELMRQGYMPIGGIATAVLPWESQDSVKRMNNGPRIYYIQAMIRRL